jgi:hypothetical protein
VRAGHGIANLVWAGLILLAAACGSGSTTTVTGPTNTVTETVTAPASSQPSTGGGSTGQTISAPTATPARLQQLCGGGPPCDDFVTPSGNIVCFASARQHGYVECAIKSGLVPAPPKDGCDLDQPGLWVASRGASRPSCRSDPSPAWFDKQIPSLDYEATWVGYGTRCLSKQTGLRCTNRDGHGFFLSRQSWSTF